MKCPETQTYSVTYHNKTMYQVSVEYVEGCGEKSLKNHRWDGQTQSKPIVPSGKTGRGLITEQNLSNKGECNWKDSIYGQHYDSHCNSTDLCLNPSIILDEIC